MKSFTAILLCMACAVVSAQDQPDNRVHFACVAVTPMKFLKCHTTFGYDNLHILADDPRYTSGADFARHAQVGDHWWPSGPDPIVVTLAASDIHQEGRVYRLTGNSEIHTTAVTVLADDIVYHSDTGTFELLGNVRVTPITPAQ